MSFEEDRHREISVRVAQRMRELGYTQADLCRDAGLSYQQFNRVFKGRAPWARDYVHALVGPLKTTFEWLIADAEGLSPWSYDSNKKPVVIGDTIVNDVHLLLGNHTDPIEIHPTYDHSEPEIPPDIAAEEAKLRERAYLAAAAKGAPYYNGPAVRLRKAREMEQEPVSLRTANETQNYQASDGREVKRVVLELGQLPWHTHMVLNGFLDDEKVFGPGDTIRKRYGNPAQVYEHGPDLSWCRLSKIFTVLMTPITRDGYGLVQMRSKSGVGFAAGLLISGISENMHRFHDETMDGDIAKRANAANDMTRKVDHHYEPKRGAPSPLLTAMRGLAEEVSPKIAEELQSTLHRYVFLNLIFGFPHFHPFLVGVVELPYDKQKTERIMKEYPGRDHGEGTQHFLKLDRGDPETSRLLSEPQRWYAPGLAALITSMHYWEHTTGKTCA